MTELRDSIYYSQLARKARQLASAHDDPVAARRLRETAVQHDRMSRKLAKEEGAASPQHKPRRNLLKDLFPFF